MLKNKLIILLVESIFFLSLLDEWHVDASPCLTCDRDIINEGMETN